jgi:DNA ligase (NAD+)
MGGALVGSVSSRVDYVVAGEGIGPAKAAKAQALKIPILTEQDFLSLREERH